MQPSCSLNNRCYNECDTFTGTDEYICAAIVLEHIFFKKDQKLFAFT